MPGRHCSPSWLVSRSTTSECYEWLPRVYTFTVHAFITRTSTPSRLKYIAGAEPQSDQAARPVSSSPVLDSIIMRVSMNLNGPRIECSPSTQVFVPGLAQEFLLGRGKHFLHEPPVRDHPLNPASQLLDVIVDDIHYETLLSIFNLASLDDVQMVFVRLGFIRPRRFTGKEPMEEPVQDQVYLLQEHPQLHRASSPDWTQSVAHSPVQSSRGALQLRRRQRPPNRIGPLPAGTIGKWS